ncbi:Hexosyltransferase [Caligus rogercresseyi]|uniref:Hexosyltransferase n=1 Tax=Caligus rogercresseyi TaxID=217165 RepID=A0A7T8GNW7_CALRO|nr:Hexosyltransferase [Caligus rogercresseyi]
MADSYPLRPSESGSILSKELVRILSGLRRDLRSFGDVSASLSVWLAPFNMELKEDNDFVYGNQSSCPSSTVAYGPLNPEAMMEAWNSYLRCDQICSCPR